MRKGGRGRGLLNLYVYIISRGPHFVTFGKIPKSSDTGVMKLAQYIYTGIWRWKSIATHKLIYLKISVLKLLLITFQAGQFVRHELVTGLNDYDASLKPDNKT